MSGPVIFVLIDGLALAMARQCMSCLAAMTESGKLRTGKYDAFLPPLSRPAYAALLSGQIPLQHGILSNENCKAPLTDTFFHIARRAGFGTAAAAYGWFKELCCGGDFSLTRDRFVNDAESPIQHGIFYGSDAYPDAELFADAESLRINFNPDLLLLHCMGADNVGHLCGGESPQYKDAVREIDGLLAKYLPVWLAKGYSVIISSDHGMNVEGRHYDTDQLSRSVPLWQSSEWAEKTMPRSAKEFKDCILAELGLKAY